MTVPEAKLTQSCGGRTGFVKVYRHQRQLNHQQQAGQRSKPTLLTILYNAPTPIPAEIHAAMPGIKKRQNDSSVNALVAAAEGGDLVTLRQLLDVIDPNSQTVVSPLG